MPKVQVASFARPKLVTETRTFENPYDKNQPFVFTFKTRYETVELSEALLGAERLYAQFGPGNPPLQWQGEDLKITLGLCQQIATLDALDAAEPPNRYTFEEWVIISAGFRQVFADLIRWAGEFTTRQPEVKNELPNGSAAVTDSVSALPQNMGTSATPKSSDE